MLTRHPWLGQAFGSHLLYGPGKARHDDHSLALYEKAGFSPADADRVAATVFIFVLGDALGSAAQVSLTRRLGRTGDPEKGLADAVAAAAEIGMAFPRLRERIVGSSGAGYAEAPDSTFEFGLRATLAGFEALLRSENQSPRVGQRAVACGGSGPAQSIT
ncbi:TetR/AcrR family transcriptional regulator C-terminal domain-containing protein [Streptomyces sp. XY332]|uniref:TetR/AcrR family transcriptional regulator C-terminal domain-containing protein n=1 Tax=Streptomyces sp. XY332 TaxID=1415561 RepID=UPI001F4033F8|nr:TetR/AcrR family transcriptional regulator C-terminal domain-containing protein [Streptomyces sp. XY332]